MESSTTEGLIALIIIIVAVVSIFIVVGYLFGVGLKLAFGAIDNSGQLKVGEEKPDLKCLFYNDGRFAVIDNMDYYHCHIDNWKLVSWFLKHGYHIDAINDSIHTGNGEISARIYMSR